MPNEPLKNKKIAILATDGFEQVELTRPWAALTSAGAQVHVVSPEPGPIQGMNHHDKGERFGVDKTVDKAEPAEYDALLLPGGVANPDTLRTHDGAVAFVRAFFDQGKPVAAICHGPWTMIEADVVNGRTLTSWPSLKTDILNAGGKWVDEEVHVDRGLVTSRKPDDLEAFCEAMITEFAGAAAGSRA